MSRDANADKKKKRILKPDSVIETKKTKIQDGASSKDHESLLFHAEEEEAEARDAEQDVQLFKSACSSIRDNMKFIQGMKKQKAGAEDLEAKKIDVSLQFVMLKKLNRLAHFRCRRAREATNEAKQQIEKYHLQLQNLLYETMHLQKEITKCLEFKSKDEEVELVTVDEFYRDAPERISRPITKEDPHQLTLARLEWELEQRKELAGKLQEAQLCKEKISQEIRSKEDYLDTLQPKLISILEATKPVQNYLKMPYDEVREQHQTARHLPLPLYVLYMQGSAYQQACDKYLRVNVEGDVNAAKSLSLEIPEPDDDSDSDQDDQDQEKRNSKRRRKTVEARLCDKKQKVICKHPLSVTMEISGKEGSTLHLTLSYLPALNIITVGVNVLPSKDVVTSCITGGDLLSPQSILDELYPGDHGETTPNPASQYELGRYGMGDFSQYVAQLGRPYIWAQWLGGLQFLESCELEGACCSAQVRPNTSVSATYMQQTIKRLRQRLKSRLGLLQQLASLERGIVSISGPVLKTFPVKVTSQLMSWKRVTHSDFAVLPHAKAILDAGFANKNDLYFLAILERGSARLSAHVVVSVDYPEVAPVFVTSVAWQTQRTAINDIHIKEMEEEVNVHYAELTVDKSQEQLLSCQLQRLLVCFDVYLETEVVDVSAPVEIPKEKVIPRVCRGPGRNKPYRYVPELAIFTQR
ncbi:THO complex subunit 5 homolog B-like isoform X2 [Pomacea canaliculata]|uniref:THO complex subunit 5 homolog B-like isoform X2 n=1 Tax=Pomacea canaliculata TaxID=400727 RepID=UPI000D7286E0|nr:THO complex subunit 5 homolog B-like isoform X2 [Pomacea canaliculata]